MDIQLDILAIVAHPDDAELAFGGALAASVALGKKVGIVDLTQGEMGTRGDAATRLKEAKAAAAILGVLVRHNLYLADCMFENNPESRLLVIDMIRRYRPEIVLTNAPSDRHPDHGRASCLVVEACFYSGLKKITTDYPQWRPKKVLQGIQSNYLQPDFLFDVSDFWQTKMDAVMAYESQFYNPANTEEQTFISTPEFLDFLQARAREWGQAIGVKYAEGFVVPQLFGIKDFSSLI